MIYPRLLNRILLKAVSAAHATAAIERLSDCTKLPGWSLLLLLSVSACADGMSGSMPASASTNATEQVEVLKANNAVQSNESQMIDSKLDPDVKRLVEKIDAIRQEHGVAAVGLTLVSADQVLYVGASGVRDWQSKQAVNEHTGFRLGSITKSFTGLTALRLQREHPGLLTRNLNLVAPNLLDDPFTNEAITLANLLEHTAGLSDLSKSEFDVQDPDISYIEALKVDPQTRQLRWPAGLHSSYSNAGYGLAGHVLELVFEKPFEHLMHEQVLQPLGMRHTGFQIDQSAPSIAQGYDRDGRTVIPYWQMIYRSFGALDTTPADMALFLQALLRQPTDAQLDGTNTPSLLFETNQERQFFENPSTTLSAAAGLEYGYGLGNYHWFFNGARFHGHGGDADGYLSHYAYQAESGLAYFVVVTAFNHVPLRQMRNELERYIAAQLPRSKKTSVKLRRSELERWVGRYESVTQRFGPVVRGGKTIQVRIRKGRLETVINKDVNQLVAESEYLFRRPWQPAATYAFVESADGEIYLQGDTGNFRRMK